jgi:hypothetical protein
MHKKKAGSKRSCLRYLVSIIFILPTMLVFLIAIDIVYMCVSVIVYPILLPFSLFPIGLLMLDKYEDGQNSLLSKLLGLSQMEI